MKVKKIVIATDYWTDETCSIDIYDENGRLALSISSETIPEIQKEETKIVVSSLDPSISESK